MNLEQWLELFLEELVMGDFAFDQPNLPLAWEVFRRLLREPVEHDAGAHVSGAAWAFGEAEGYRLLFARRSESDESYSAIGGVAFEVPLTDALRGKRFELRQRPFDTFEQMSLEEFIT